MAKDDKKSAAMQALKRAFKHDPENAKKFLEAKPEDQAKITDLSKNRQWRNSKQAARFAINTGQPEDFFTTGPRGANSKTLPKPRRQRGDRARKYGT